jgi:hypothetical protein
MFSSSIFDDFFIPASCEELPAVLKQAIAKDAYFSYLSPMLEVGDLFFKIS